MKRPLCAAVLIPICLLLACEISNRTLYTADGELEVRAPIQISRSPSLLWLSSDGTLMAIAELVDEETVTVEVREVDTQRVLASWQPTRGDEVWPILFGTAGDELYCLVGRDEVYSIAAMHLPSGEMRTIRELGRAEPPAEAGEGTEGSSQFGESADALLDFLDGSAVNYDASLAYLHTGLVIGPDTLVTGSGKVVDVRGHPEAHFFDMYGNIWTRENGEWARYGKDGSVSPGLPRPPYLVENQSRLRGAMSLAETEATMKHEGATAYVSALWLCHAKSVPPPDHDAGLAGPWRRAALVDVAPDIVAYGFVPGRDMVWITSHLETWLVPFERRPYQPAEDSTGD
jgi:hypothetical protein